VIAVVGGLLGLALALVAVPLLSRALSGIVPVLILSPTILLAGFVAALFVGFISGFLPGLGAMRLRVVNALRRV